MKLSEILSKLQGLNWTYNLETSEIITDKNIRLSVNAQVDGLFAGQITLACVYKNRVIYRYGAVDLRENEMIAEWYLNIKNNVIMAADTSIIEIKFKKELGLD